MEASGAYMTLPDHNEADRRPGQWLALTGLLVLGLGLLCVGVSKRLVVCKHVIPITTKTSENTEEMQRIKQ